MGEKKERERKTKREREREKEREKEKKETRWARIINIFIFGSITKTNI